MASLESVRLGFQFDDNTFINVSTESDNYRRIKDGQNGLYYANRLISEVSERFGLKLNPDASLLQIHEGGLCPAETVDGQLYVIESIDTIEDTSPQPTKSCEKSRENDEAEGFSWKHSSVLLLLETYRAHKNDFSSSTKRKNDIWKRIAQEMEETGYTVKPLQCEKKWSNLKIRYKKIVDSNNKTGRGHQTWAYFDAMQELLHNDPSVTAPVTVSSLNGKKAVLEEQRTENEKNKSSDIPCSNNKRKRKDEPPAWFKEWSESSMNMMKELVSETKRKNDLLEKLIEKI